MHFPALTLMREFYILSNLTLILILWRLVVLSALSNWWSSWTSHDVKLIGIAIVISWYHAHIHCILVKASGS